MRMASWGDWCERASPLVVELHSLPFKSFTRRIPLFAIDVFDALSPVSSVERREVDGGTGPVAVRAQLEAARASLITPPDGVARHGAGPVAVQDLGPRK